MSATLAPKLSFSRFRGDSNIDYAELQKRLSPFQIEKLKTFFKVFFDIDGNGVIDEHDFKLLNEKLRKIAGWETSSDEYNRLVDTNSVFFECLLDQVKVEQFLDKEGLENRTWEEALRPSKVVVNNVTLNQWLNMWAKLCSEASGINDFPIWVQLIPQVMFSVQQGKNKLNHISKDCLRHFYENFAGVKGSELEKLTEEGYNTMTANGDYELNLENYNLLFSNFMLGRTIYGPGKFLFGCFDNSDLHKKYQVIFE